MHKGIKDLTGKIFGRLIVIGLDNENNKKGGARWICKCKCGEEKSILSTNLISGDIVSCGCYKKEFNSTPRLEELKIGQRFGKLVVIERVDDYVYPNKRHKVPRYKCVCDCGTETCTLEGNLRNGKIIQCETCSKIKDLKGKRYGMLVVVSLDHVEYHSGAVWNCKCDCGNNILVVGSRLGKQNVISCGCSRESGMASELKLYFIDNYNATKEYRLVKSPYSDNWLRCDIYIYSGENPKINGVYIEVHGGQHYKFVKYFHKTEEGFKRRKILDNIKKKFAKKNGTYIEVDLRKIKTTEDAIEYIENIISKL